MDGTLPLEGWLVIAASMGVMAAGWFSLSLWVPAAVASLAWLFVFALTRPDGAFELGHLAEYRSFLVGYLFIAFGIRVVKRLTKIGRSN